MHVLIEKKGNMRKHVHVEEIEEFILNSDHETFLPVKLCVDDLVKKGYIRFFTKDNGKVTYGLSKKAIASYQGFIERMQQKEKVGGS